jgi:hypothetical protein
MKNNWKIARLATKTFSSIRLLSAVFCFAALLVHGPAPAQTAAVLQGTVTDRTTGQPVSGAAVYVNNSNTGVSTDVKRQLCADGDTDQ